MLFLRLYSLVSEPHICYLTAFLTHSNLAMASQYIINKVVEIGDTLHRCGCPPYKVEKYTQHYAQKHGADVMVQAMPTSINYQFLGKRIPWS